MSDAEAPLVVVEVDPAKVDPAPGNRPVTIESVSDLLESMKVQQLVPAILYPHPTDQGRWIAADGNRRAMASRILSRPLKAILLPAAPSKMELLRIRVVANFHRENASAYELAADIEAWLEESKDTQKAAAVFFSMSESQVSKILAKAKSATQAVIDAEKDGRICADVGRLIATVAKEKQGEVLAHVIANKMSRDQTEGYVATVKGFKKPNVKPIVATDGGATVKFPANWSFQRIIEFAGKLQEAAKQGLKVPGLTVTALPGLLKPQT